MRLNRAAFMAGSLAAMSVPLQPLAKAAASPAAGLAPDDALARLMSGNSRFVANDFPTLTQLAEKRALLTESQAPFAAILSCADSRVIPELIFEQGIGQLFVTRVAGNYPDDLVTGSLEYAVEHLGTRLIMVLGHQNCGAVKAVYDAIKTNTPLPPHLSTIERFIAPGLRSVVGAGGSIAAAVESNVRAAAAGLRTAGPVIAEDVGSSQVRVVGAVYQLGSGRVRLVD